MGTINFEWDENKNRINACYNGNKDYVRLNKKYYDSRYDVQCGKKSAVRRTVPDF